MNDSERAALMLVSRLLEYPDEAWFSALDQAEDEAGHLLAPESARTVLDFCACMKQRGELLAMEDYVRTFDHDPGGSLYLAWHRYGNDRSQGRAMAALNGLYRAAGLEPAPGTMPDYLPRILEFLSVCEGWAAAVLLDGFGPELAKLSSHLSDESSAHAPLLDLALAPLKRDFPQCFWSRSKPDPTIRPMARPEEEILTGKDFI